MIIGSVSFSFNGVTPSLMEHLRRVTDSEALTFHPVVNGAFTGGYYLHPQLPYTPADIYYFDPAQDIMVMLSGSVYNKAELCQLSDIPSSVPEPGLIAALFMQDGPGFVRRLNGDFAIFIWEPAKKEAFLFRDHVGIRPISWATDGQALYFSSDINGLCKAFADDQGVDSEYLLGFFKYIDFRKTPCSKVKKMLPGHFLHFSENGTEISRYWQPEKIRAENNLSYDRMLFDLKDILWDAVHIRCDGRFNAGAHVSGGIDSGIVSALARREYDHQKTFYGFSWSPGDFSAGDAENDERELVRSSCDKAGILPVLSDMSPDGFRNVISSFSDNYDLIFEYNTVKQAAAAKTNLIFSGWGGDEFISTGGRAVDQDLLRLLKLRTFFSRNPLRQARRFIRTQLNFVIFPALGILDSGTARQFRNDARYILEPFRKSDRKAIRNFFFHTSRRKLHLQMLLFYHLQSRCESWMINGYRQGVEYRYPLLDRRIVEYMLKVPSILLCRTGHFRPLLRELGEGIMPEEVRLNRSKTDPVSWTYLRELFKASARSLMEEIDEWKSNKDLFFVDFDLLDEDIRKYRGSSVDINDWRLVKALVYVKVIHEFTKRYRDN